MSTNNSNAITFPVKRGSTIYNTTTGEPMLVVRTRTISNGTRLSITVSGGYDTLLRRNLDGTFAFTGGDYTLTQTAALAKQWAKELKRREQQRDLENKWFDAKRKQRLAFRAQMNAPTRVSGTEVRNEREIVVTTTNWHLRGGDRAPLLPMLVQEKYDINVSISEVRPRIVNDEGRFDYDETTMGVNWKACGTQNVEVARAYAKAILMAADMAEQANAKRSK